MPISALGDGRNTRMNAVPIVYIDDPMDQRLADYRNVPDGELLAARGLFVAEGRRTVLRLLTESVFTACSVLLTPSAHAALRHVTDTRDDLPVYLVPQRLMNDIVGFNIHRGCLALGARPAAAAWRSLAAGARRLVVLEQVGDADNVGAIFRTGAAFGIDAVLLGPRCADPLYRKAIRTSMAAALTLPFARVDEWPDAMHILRRDGISLVGLTPDRSAAPIADAAARIAGRRFAAVFGHEGDGLTDAALEACEHRARIPMARSVDSLNVAAAAAIALYLFTRS